MLSHRNFCYHFFISIISGTEIKGFISLLALLLFIPCIFHTSSLFTVYIYARTINMMNIRWCSLSRRSVMLRVTRTYHESLSSCRWSIITHDKTSTCHENFHFTTIMVDRHTYVGFIWEFRFVIFHWRDADCTVRMPVILRFVSIINMYCCLLRTRRWYKNNACVSKKNVKCCGLSEKGF